MKGYCMEGLTQSEELIYALSEQNHPQSLVQLNIEMFNMRWSGYAGLASSVVPLRFTGNICQTEEYFSYYIDKA